MAALEQRDSVMLSEAIADELAAISKFGNAVDQVRHAISETLAEHDDSEAATRGKDPRNRATVDLALYATGPRHTRVRVSAICRISSVAS
jgi:hypothetical protein